MVLFTGARPLPLHVAFNDGTNPETAASLPVGIMRGEMALVTINALRFLVVRVCVTDVGVAVTNLRVVCKIITCVSAFTFTDLELEMATLIFLEIVKTAAKLLLQVWILCVAGYAKDAIVGPYHRTSDGQVHKIIWNAGLERDTIFQLTCHSVQRARQPLS